MTDALANPAISYHQGLAGRLKDDILSRIESGTVAPKQIAQDIISDTPRDELADMLLEVAGYAIYQIAYSLSHHGRGAAVTAEKLIGEEKSAERQQFGILVPGDGWVPVGSLDAEQCDKLAAHYRELSHSYLSLSKVYAGLAKRLRGAAAGATLRDVLDEDALRAVGEKVAA